MALHLYEGEKHIPKNMIFIYDIESEFNRVGITDIDMARRFIEMIEKGKFLDNRRFLDRFGAALYLDELSTSTKALIALSGCKDKVLNFMGVGKSAINLALITFTEGYIYVPRYYSTLETEMKIDIIVNDKDTYDNAFDFNEDWGE